MLNQEFEQYAPQQWQDDGIVKVAPRRSRKAPPVLRKAEKWRGAVMVGAVAFVALIGGMTSQELLFIPAGPRGLSGTLIGTQATEHRFVQTTQQFEVSPEYWLKLVQTIRCWEPLPPDDTGPDLEPAI